MADRTISVDLVGNDRSMSRTLDKAGDAAARNSGKMQLFGKDADEVGKKVAAGAGKFQLFTGKVALGATAMVHAAAAGQQLVATGIALSGTLGVIPGVVAAGALSMVSLKLAVHGVGDAMTESDPKKYAADLKGLAPEAQTAVKAIHALNPELTDLRKTVQGSFFSGFANDIKPIVTQELPLFRNVLADISGYFGQAVGGVTGFLKSADGINAIETILNNADDAALGFASSLSPIAVGLLKVTAVSSTFLPKLTDGLGEAGVKAGAFLDKITQGGADSKLAGWIQGGFDEITKLSGKFKELAHDADNPKLKSDAIQLFSAMKSAASDVDRELPKVVTAVEDLAPALANIVKDSGGAFGSSLHTYATAAIILAPAITGVTKALGPLSPILGVVVPLLYVGAKGIQLWMAAKEVITVIKEWTIVQEAFNIVTMANPIGAVVIAIAAFVAIVVIAWKKSDTFRAVVITVFKAVADVVLGAISAILGAFSGLFGVLSHLPGKAGAAFKSLKGAADNAKAAVDHVKSSIDAIPAHSHKYLQITTTQTIRTQTINSNPSGDDVVHRASGGPVQAGRPYIVGEHQPELFVPSQSGTIIPRVPSSAGTAAGGGDTYYMTFNVQPGTDAHAFARAVVDAINKLPGGAKQIKASAVSARG